MSADSALATTPEAGPAVDNDWRRVRVVGPTGSVAVSLPTSRTVADLVAELLTTLLPGAPLGRVSGGWHLHRVGQPPLAPECGLLDGRVVDGDVLHLTPSAPPPPAEFVDDVLDVLAGESAGVGQWNATARAWVVAVALIGCASGAGALCLVRPTLPWLVVSVLLGLALLATAARLGSGDVTEDSSGAGPVPDGPVQTLAGQNRVGGVRAPFPAASEVLALASLPPWLCTAASGTHALGLGSAAAVALGGPALALTAGTAAVVAPRLLALWAFLATVGLALGLGAAPAALGVVTTGAAAAISGCLALLATGALPQLAVRAGPWLAPGTGTLAALRAHAWTTRTVVAAITAAASTVVAGSAVRLTTSTSDGASYMLARALAAALALGLVLRARRSRYVVESLSLLTGSVTAVGVLVGGLIPHAGQSTRLALLAGLLVMLLVLSTQLDTAALRRAGRRQRPRAPRVRGALDNLEAVATASLLPLLAGYLGLYQVTADAASRL